MLRNRGEVLYLPASFPIYILESVGELFGHYLHVRLYENIFVIAWDVAYLEFADAQSAPTEEGVSIVALGPA